jgi:hypothetical protein
MESAICCKEMIAKPAITTRIPQFTATMDKIRRPIETFPNRIAPLRSDMGKTTTGKFVGAKDIVWGVISPCFFGKCR